MNRPVILTVQDYFLPGFKGGGSLRSVANVVAHLSEQFDFRVVARDRDHGDRQPYEGVGPDWHDRGDCKVLYLSPRQVTPWGLARLVNKLDFDLVYLNSFFSTLSVFLLTLRRCGLLRDRPVILAPRGELAANALALKRRKKALWLWLANRLGLYRGLTWQVSSELERAEVQRLFNGPVVTAMDLSAVDQMPTRKAKPPIKIPGEIRLVFLSRISRKKNLHGAIELIGKLQGNVAFDIYGTLEDPEYWAECLQLIASLPPQISCAYRGAVPHKQVVEVLAGYHFFLLPTLNENFGHVILEALSAGLPLVISDQTPWRGLVELGVGYDLPLGEPSRFVECLQGCVAMEQKPHRHMSENAHDLAALKLGDKTVLKANVELFRGALAP